MLYLWVIIISSKRLHTAWWNKCKLAQSILSRCLLKNWSYSNNDYISKCVRPKFLKREILSKDNLSTGALRSSEHNKWKWEKASKTLDMFWKP